MSKLVYHLEHNTINGYSFEKKYWLSFRHCDSGSDFFTYYINMRIKNKVELEYFCTCKLLSLSFRPIEYDGLQ